MTKITLCMLLYNSGKYIPESIGNMFPYVDEVVVTVDTRTTDNTRDLLMAMGNKVKFKEYVWQHHYGEAKNELIRMVTPIEKDSWIIIYDDDEKMTDKDCWKLTKYIRESSNTLGSNIGGLLVPRKNVYPEWIYDEGNYLKWLYPDRHMIAFRRIDGVGYDSRVHEWASNSLITRGYTIINYDEVCTWHHAWKGDRDKNANGKHHYYIALSRLGNSWNGDINNVQDNDVKNWLGWKYEG